MELKEKTEKQCPHCGGDIYIIDEGKNYIKHFQKKIRFARLICENNNPFDFSNRCYYKSTAGIRDRIIMHLNELAI